MVTRTAMQTRRRDALAVGIAAVSALILTACGGGSDDPSTETTEPTATPTTDLTAPPTLSEEEQVAADLEAMYGQIIAATDQLAARATSFEDPGQNQGAADEIIRTLADAGATDIAAANLASDVIAFNAAGLNATGASALESFDATVSLEPVEGQTQPTATATACVDTSQVSYVVAETGEPYDGPRVGYGMQQTLTFYYLDQAVDAFGKTVGDAGWYLTVIDEEDVQQC